MMPRSKSAKFTIWLSAIALSGVCLASGEKPKEPSQTPTFLEIRVKPGYFYELTLPNDDDVKEGTTWNGTRLVHSKSAAGANELSPANPLRPMHRKRCIIKADDLATWSLDRFKLFARFIEKHNAKAGLGIIPGQCVGDDVFAWLRTVDLDRFEIWNHTWLHGHDGPDHYEQPYDVQWRNLERAHRKVLEETGITMHSWCGGGIRYRGGGVHDQDQVTHWIVRNHPDYKVHFHARSSFADRGYGNINSQGIFMPWRYSWYETEGLSGNTKLIQKLQQRWPETNWNRPSALGNADELKWRFDHPFWNVPESDEIDNTVIQLHPGMYDSDEKLKPLGELFEYIKSKEDWCFENAYETYKWLADRDDVILKKIGGNTYRLDVKAVRFPHVLKLDLAIDTAVSEHAFHVRAYE